MRLHNLGRSFSSHAVLQGDLLLVISRMLGHKRPSIMLCYAHVGDPKTEAAAEQIGETIVRALSTMIVTASCLARTACAIVVRTQ